MLSTAEHPHASSGMPAAHVAEMGSTVGVPRVSTPDRRAGLAAWALGVGLLLVVFGVVPELVADDDLAVAPTESVAQGLQLAEGDAP